MDFRLKKHRKQYFIVISYPGSRDYCTPALHVHGQEIFKTRFQFPNHERIVAGPDILPEKRDYSIIFPYGWEKKQLTREMRRMFPRNTGRRVLIMLDEYHKFFDSREKQ